MRHVVAGNQTLVQSMSSLLSELDLCPNMGSENIRLLSKVVKFLIKVSKQLFCVPLFLPGMNCRLLAMVDKSINDHCLILNEGVQLFAPRLFIPLRLIHTLTYTLTHTLNHALTHTLTLNLTPNFTSLYSLEFGEGVSGVARVTAARGGS